MCYQNECLEDLDVKVYGGEGGGMSDRFLVENLLGLVGGCRV